MPISVEQWRSVVGSNGIRRPRQVGPKRFYNYKARGRSGCGSQRFPFSVLSLINEGLTIMLFALLWLWSYQYTGTLESGNKKRM